MQKENGERDFTYHKMTPRQHYRWAMQLCVHFGIDIDLDSFLEEVNDFQVPPCFDREQLVLLNTFGIGWWDETHKQCFIGIF